MIKARSKKKENKESEEELFRTIARTGAINAKVQGPRAKPKTKPSVKVENNPFAFLSIRLMFKPGKGKMPIKNKPLKMKIEPTIIFPHCPRSPIILPSVYVITPIIATELTMPEENMPDKTKRFFVFNPVCADR